jgi:hypothetical protein
MFLSRDIPPSLWPGPGVRSRSAKTLARALRRSRNFQYPNQPLKLPVETGELALKLNEFIDLTLTMDRSSPLV